VGAAELELAREFVRTYNERDIDGLAELCHEDVEARSIYAGLEAGGVFRGRDGFPYTYFAEIDQMWEFFRLEDATYDDRGDVVVIDCEMCGRGRSSGVEYRARIWVVWRMRDGKLWLERTLTDEADLDGVVAALAATPAGS
jgi:ketosteroid isomerase-like protein